MTNVVIVIEGGMVQYVYTRNKNIRVEVIDLDVNGDEDAERFNTRRLSEIENSKSYKDIFS